MLDDTIPDARRQGDSEDEATDSGAGTVLDYLFNVEPSVLPEGGAPSTPEDRGATPDSAELRDALAKYASWLDSLRE